MNYLTKESILIYIFLGINLLIGLLFSRNIKSFKEYALGNKIYGTGVITITFLATYFSGDNTIGKQASIIKYGIVAGLVIFGTAINYIYSALFIVPKLAKFRDSITIGDIMANIYGYYGGVIMGFLGSVLSICLLGAQFVAIGHICNLVLGWPVNFTIVIFGLVLTTYASIGGIKSVTIVDILQFITFIIVIPIIANLAINKAGGIKNIFINLPPDKLNINNKRYIINFLCLTFIPTMIVDPAVMSKILMAKNNKNASRMLIIGASIIVFITGLLTLTALAVLTLKPNIKPAAGEAFLFIMDNYMSFSLRTFSMIGILSIIISTIDSVLNAGGVLLTHNVIKPIFEKAGKNLDELKIVKWLSFTLGIIGIIIALPYSSQIRSLIYIGISLFIPIVGIPFIAGIMGLKGDEKQFIISSILTIAMFFIFNVYVDFKNSYSLSLILTFANTIIFLALHFIKNKGFILLNDSLKNNTQKVNPKLNFKNLLNDILNIPLTVNKYWETYSKKYRVSYITFSFFICFNYLVPYFISSGNIITTIFILKLIGIFLCIGLMLKEYWPKKIEENYFHIYWNLTLLYCLPFANTIFYIINQGNVYWLINISLSIIILIITIDWKSFIFFSILGVSSGFLIAKYILNFTIPYYENGYELIYGLTCAIMIGIFLIRVKQNDLETAIKQKYNLTNSQEYIEARLIHELTIKNRLINVLDNNGLELIKYHDSLENELKDNNKVGIAKQKIFSLLKYINNVIDQVQNYMMLNVSNTQIGNLINNSIEMSVLKYGENLITLINSEIKNINCDIKRIQTVIFNSITLISKEYPNDTLNIFVEDTLLGYKLDFISSYTKKIEALRITVTTLLTANKLESMYIGDLNKAIESTVSNVTDLMKLDNEQIVASHYGIYNHGKNIIEIIIPINIYDIRPKKLDHPTILKNTKEVIVTNFNAIDIEFDFLKKVKNKAPKINISTLNKALELIKKHHNHQNRKTGEPFYSHPVSVAEILLDYTQEEDAIIAALLHDVVEDTKVNLSYLEVMFNPRVAQLVDGVTKLDKNGRVISDVENIIKLTNQIGQTDSIALYIKICDRIHNMRTIQGHKSLEKIREITKETVQFFIPLCKQLGLSKAEEELKELTFNIFNQQL